MLAAILGAAFVGIEDGMPPPDPITGNAYEQQGLPQLANDLPSAVSAWERAPLVARIFDSVLIENLAMTKRQEIARFANRPAEEHWLSYLEAV
jgi:glutamine synthetase